MSSIRTASSFLTDSLTCILNEIQKDLWRRGAFPAAFGTNADGSINEDYCKYCYVNGEFIDKVSMEEYIEMCSQFGAQAGMTNEEMKAYCEKLFPTLKRWKK